MLKGNSASARFAFVLFLCWANLGRYRHHATATVYMSDLSDLTDTLC